MAQISDFLLHAKILPILKAFFHLNLPHSTLGKKDIALIFLYLTNMACSEVAAFLQTVGAHYISNVF